MKRVLHVSLFVITYLICDIQATAEGTWVKTQLIILFDLPRDTPRTIFGRITIRCIIFFTENSEF